MKRGAANQVIRQMPILNLHSRPFRTAALIALVTFLSFALFGGSVLAISLQRGLNSVKARFGADLIAIPLGYDTGMEAILLKGEPSFFYLDKSYLEKIKEVEGVEQATAQFYLTSTGSDCCDLPVQLIGFDPDTDFSIRPWIRESYGGTIPPGALLVGNDIRLDDKREITFFGREYPVAALLDKTGTGLDSAVYTDMDTLYGMMAAAQEKGFHFLDQVRPEAMISSVLVKAERGYDAETVGRNIRAAMDGLQIVKTQSMISGIAKNLDAFSGLLFGTVGALLLVGLVMLALVFSMTANERKKEFAVLRILGATGKRLALFLLREALLVSVAGGILGVSLAALVVFPFNKAISQQLGLPFLMPQAAETVRLVLASLLISFAAGPAAASHAALRISRTDASITLREGE